jgi:selenocysteine-specific elongation factor
VDRCFLQKGFGVIITGTARGQKLEVGSSIMLMPEGIEGRVRSIQHHGSEQKHTQAGERTAINIVGIEKEQVQRGALLCTAETIPQTSIIDVRYHHLGDAPQLKDGSRVRILQGSMEVLARFSIVSDQDELEEGPLLLQLRTEKPIITLPNDRFILRQESPLRTLGGGVVLDPWAQRFRKKYKKRTNDQLLNIESGDRQLLLERRGISGASQACIALWECEGISLDRQWVSSRIIENEIPRIIEKLVDWHKQNPLQIGCPIKELVHHHPLPISAKGYGLLIEEAQKKGSLSRPEKGIVALPDFSIELTAEQDKKKSSILETITSSNLEGVPLSNYSTEPLINFLISNGALLRIQQQLVSQKSIQALLSRLDEYFSIHKILTPNAFKEQTQLSRKYAIPMLEWLDTKGYTLRTGEGRIKREHS